MGLKMGTGGGFKGECQNSIGLAALRIRHEEDRSRLRASVTVIGAHTLAGWEVFEVESTMVREGAPAGAHVGYL